MEGGHRSDTIGLATIDIDDKIVRFMSSQEIHEYKSRGMAGKNSITPMLTVELTCYGKPLSIILVFQLIIMYWSTMKASPK